MSHNQLVKAFRNLAQRLERFESAAVKSDHLAEDVGATMVQAGYLIIEAIDAGAFPESRKEANAGWWSREHARIPGGPVAWYDTIQKAFNEECRGKSSSFKLDVVQQPSAQSAHGVWIHTIGWLARSFHSRLRHQAEASNWSHIAKDEHGRWLGKDGTPLQGHWYFNGEPLPDEFKPAPGEFMPGYQWRLDGDFLHEHERYDEADHLHSQRIRAEVSRDACSLLAELIGAAASDIDESQDSRDPAKQSVTALPVEKAASHYEVKPSVTEEREATALDDLVTLDQAAAVVGQSKRTLERYLQRNDLPRPDMPGGGGKAHRWYWSTLRPALEEHFRPDLPEKFPASRIV